MIGIASTRASLGLRQLVRSHRTRVAGRGSKMATKAESAPGAPLKAHDCIDSDRHKLANTEMALVTDLRPFGAITFAVKSPSVNL